MYKPVQNRTQPKKSLSVPTPPPLVYLPSKKQKKTHRCGGCRPTHRAATQRCTVIHVLWDPNLLHVWHSRHRSQECTISPHLGVGVAGLASEIIPPSTPSISTNPPLQRKHMNPFNPKRAVTQKFCKLSLQPCLMFFQSPPRPSLCDLFRIFFLERMRDI